MQSKSWCCQLNTRATRKLEFCPYGKRVSLECHGSCGLCWVALMKVVLQVRMSFLDFWLFHKFSRSFLTWFDTFNHVSISLISSSSSHGTSVPSVRATAPWRRCCPTATTAAPRSQASTLQPPLLGVDAVQQPPGADAPRAADGQGTQVLDLLVYASKTTLPTQHI